MLTPFLLAAAALAADPAPFAVTDDVIYGRKFGVALTLDVYIPPKPNGKGVIFCVSGGWVSAKRPPNKALVGPILDRGYTVFAVVHGSQPRFAIPEIVEDMHRAVRFVRANAKKYNVDPDKLGITGASAGGHLSLMMGTTGKPGNPKATDPVDRESSKVAAVGCFFPPTDFLNYGKDGESAIGDNVLAGFKPPFAFTEQNPVTRVFVPVVGEEKRRAIAKQISPAYHVTKDAAPALIVHGDADSLVPLQQAEKIAEAYKAAGVPCEVVVKPGANHGWPGIDKDVVTIADWFDKYLK